MLSAPSSLSPVFQPNISLYQAFFAFFVGFFLQPVVMAIRFLLRYPKVPGTYSVEREYSDGKVEPREGTIQIRRNWWRGSFSVTAFHAPDKRQWQGEMHLSLDMTNVGNGVFWHVDAADGAGDQKFRYFPEKSQFRVQGTTLKAGKSDPFLHLWTKK